MDALLCERVPGRPAAPPSLASGCKALLLAGGLGTRLRPWTDRIPKCLVPIGGRPMLDYWIDLLSEAGIGEALINTHAHAELVRCYITRVNFGGQLRLTETYEPTLLGSAGTIAANPDYAGNAQDVMIVYADNLSDVDLRQLLRFHRSHSDPLTILLFHCPNPTACGIARLDPDCRVVDFVEKPLLPKSDLANAGIYVVRREAYREIAAMGARDLGFEVLPRFINRMRGFVHDGYHLDIGTPAAYEQANSDVRELGLGRSTWKAAARPAVFLDRDGTIIDEVNYLSRPEQVRLLSGAADAIRELQRCGYACIMVTNQSAVGRGMISEADLHEIHAELTAQLARRGARLDGVYYCTTVPRSLDRTTIECVDRKPGPGMLWRAAIELGIDLSASWMVGDRISDVLAGLNAHCRGAVLLDTDRERGARTELPPGTAWADDLAAAARHILSSVPLAEKLKIS